MLIRHNRANGDKNLTDIEDKKNDNGKEIASVWSFCFALDRACFYEQTTEIKPREIQCQFMARLRATDARYVLNNIQLQT